MTEYTIEPEVAGGLGPGTVMDASMHPPRVDHLDYEFAGWDGDDLLEAFPCFVVTAGVGSALEEAHLTGFTLADLTVSSTPEFTERHPAPLPEFRRLQVTGRVGIDDMWIGDDLMLHVNDRALSVMTATGQLDHALVQPVI
jgi:hypothetical protein